MGALALCPPRGSLYTQIGCGKCHCRSSPLPPPFLHTDLSRPHHLRSAPRHPARRQGRRDPARVRSLQTVVLPPTTGFHFPASSHLSTSPAYTPRRLRRAPCPPRPRTAYGARPPRPHPRTVRLPRGDLVSTHPYLCACRHIGQRKPYSRASVLPATLRSHGRDDGGISASRDAGYGCDVRV